MTFFSTIDGSYSVCLTDVLPDGSSSAEVVHRAVYLGLIKKLPTFLAPDIRELVESLQRPLRNRARLGLIGPEDYQELIRFFHFCQADFRRRYDDFQYYKMLKAVCAQIAMMLFVDTLIKEGFAQRCSGVDETVAELASRMTELYRAQSVAIDGDNATFYAAYFVWQTLFDKVFVGDAAIVWYDEQFQLCTTDRYKHDTAYLALANQKLATASDAERRLSYLITTGWGEGINLTTWNALNQDYYSRSDDNFFSADYDDHLDKMLPQFPLSKAKAASTVVGDWDGHRGLNLIEIGAGSGSFSVDLFMAIRGQTKELGLFAYLGLEPSGAMREVYDGHFRERALMACPNHWQMMAGGLEEFIAAPREFLSDTAANVIVFSFSSHHCYHESLKTLLNLPEIQTRVQHIYILDGTLEHGWAKWTYMPLDCRSPENFENVAITGSWASETLWHEPHLPLANHALTNGWAHLRRLTPPAKALFRQVQPGFLIDLDGTVYRGKDLIPGALAFVNYLQERGWPLLFLTNRSERTPHQICNHLNQLGFRGVAPELVYTSAQATAEYLGSGSVFPIGGAGLHEVFQNPAFVIDDQQPEYLVLGMDQTLDYARLSQAVDLVSKGARFVASNGDKRMNNEQSFAPGNGAIAALISCATGQTPLVVGKPGPIMFDAGVTKLGLSRSQVFVVGDSLETDIRGGRDAGLKTILTLTGISSAQDLSRSEVVPDLVVEDLEGLVQLLKNVLTDDPAV